MQFSFRKPHFWHPPNFAKTLFWHTVALFVFLKMPKKHYKTGEKTAKKKLDQFLTLDLDQFLTLETPNLGPVFNSTLSLSLSLSLFLPLSLSLSLSPPLSLWCSHLPLMRQRNDSHDSSAAMSIHPSSSACWRAVASTKSLTFTSGSG